jgi:hypothetical protein
MDSRDSSLGFNTMAPRTILRERCMLCAGEDRWELLHALADTAPQIVREFARSLLEAAGRGERESPSLIWGGGEQAWSYRGYEFWAFPDLLIVLGGIGTGPLEPLLFEILRAAVIREIVLVGTAGAMPDSNVGTGNAYFIDEAWAAATALDSDESKWPLSPKWDHSPRSETATTVSSDFYYGFSPLVVFGGYPLHSTQLKVLFERYLAMGTDLVDMEVAQFFLFCANFSSTPLQYAAVKGVSNHVGDENPEEYRVRDALRASLALAFNLLAIPTPKS